jgi:L-iditol 2-dehydrogenase
MRALVLTDSRTLLVDEVEPRQPQPGETVVDVHRCALCRTDAKMWASGQRDLRLPRVLGHEIVGVDRDTGRRVVAWPGEACGVCEFCRSDRENLCREMRILGFNRDGGLAEQVVVRESSVIPVPKGLSDRIAVLAEPLGCCLNALAKAEPASGDRVLIFGAGPVGLLMALAARSMGALPSLTERDADKLALSHEFRLVLDIPAGIGAEESGWDICINAAPSTETLTDGLHLLKPGGRFCIFSGFPGDASVSAQVLNEVHYREIRVTGAYGCTRNHMRAGLDILNRYQAEAELLIERTVSLPEVADELERILAGVALKVLVDPRVERDPRI